EKEIWIMDWKTSTSQPRRSRLQDRMQTRLYPFLLVEAGKVIHQGIDIRPEQVQMMYWYPDFPEQAVVFQYTEEQHQANALLLKNLILEIQGMQPDDFQKTIDTRRCRFCHYRSLCERGDKAGNLLEYDSEDEKDESELSLDLEQIGEIEF
ncbi:MAG: PD-(D/E)XK nuclease family protein, partial [Anaerolineaceae bacterium]|nr:PD-(D/E)XK nuclease family protein [Anaerolineaceae bacterium]